MKAYQKYIVSGSFIAAAITFPLVVTDPYFQHIMNVVFLYSISIYAFNIITGITGQLNLAHAGFIGIGAYTSAIASVNFSMNFWLAMPLAIAVTGVFGFLIGFPSLRTKGVYFSLATLGFGEILFIVFENWIPVTGGPMGITGITAPSGIPLPGDLAISFGGKKGFYYLCLTFLFFIIYLTKQLFRSRLGQAMTAVRENESLTQSVGISIVKTKITAFVLSAMLLGLTGSLFAHYFRFISPVTFTVPETFRCLSMLVVGGMGTLMGPLLGAAIFTALPEFLRSIEEYQWMVYGIVLMLFIAFMPEGIVGFINEKTAKHHSRRQ